MSQLVPSNSETADDRIYFQPLAKSAMTKNSDRGRTPIDEIDRHILEILAGEPRLPYSDISDELADRGFDLSSEAVRQRVSSLFEITTNFFLVRPDRHEWELVLVTLNTADEPGAKQDVFEALSEMGYWFVGSGFGTIDVYAIATVKSTENIDTLLEKTRTLTGVVDFEYFIETDRMSAVEKYLQIS